MTPAKTPRRRRPAPVSPADPLTALLASAAKLNPADPAARWLRKMLDQGERAESRPAK